MIHTKADIIANDNLPPNFEIPIIPASELSYTRALNEFFIPNLPFIISEATENWSAQNDWIVPRTSPNSRSEGTNGNLKEREDNTQVSEGSMPNWDHLARNYGEMKVNVLQCKVEEVEGKEEGSPISNLAERNDTNTPEEKEEGEEYGAGEMIEMTFNQVINSWKNGKGKGLYIKDWHLPLQIRERSKAMSSCHVVADLKSSSGLSNGRNTDTATMKGTGNKEQGIDDEFERQEEVQMGKGKEVEVEERREKKFEEEEHQDDDDFYKTPNMFLNDWMNNYYISNTKDDFTFVYFGTKGTFTPLHRDVYTSYSWSANILGRKAWYLIPPSSIPYCRLNPSNPNSLLHSDIRPGKIDTVKYPEFKKVKVFKIIQEKGSIIYIPSNWYHCVENLDEFVISINKNWCNEINLFNLFNNMKSSIKEIRNELKDDILDILKRRKKIEVELDVEKEFEEIVQDVLIQNVGWGWETFYSMIEYNLLHPPAPPSLSPPRSLLKATLLDIFADYETERKNRLRASSYDSALEAALSIINEG